MFKAVRLFPLLSVAAVAVATPALHATCVADSWSLSPNSLIVIHGVACVGAPNGAGGTRLFLPDSITDPNPPVAGNNYGVLMWDGTTLTQYGGYLSPPNDTVQVSAIYNNQLVLSVYGASNTNQVVAWDGSSWVPFAHTGGDGNADGLIEALLADSHGDLVVGGQFTQIDGVTANGIAKWDHTTNTWQAFGSGLGADANANPGQALALAEYPTTNGNIYAAGDFLSAGGTPANNIAYWSGGTWHALGGAQGGGVGQTNSFFPTGVFVLTVYNNKLIVGGSFGAVGGNDATDPSDPSVSFTNNIAAWDGSNWSAFGTGIVSDANPGFAAVDKFAVLGNDLYVGSFAGYADDADGTTFEGVARLTNSTWSAVNPTSLETALSSSPALAAGNMLVAFQSTIVADGSDSSFNYEGFVSYTPTCPCPADFDGNNTINVSDIFAFLRAWFSHSSSADIDGNSVVNVSDIFAFLRHWFSHC